MRQRWMLLYYFVLCCYFVVLWFVVTTIGEKFNSVRFRYDEGIICL